MNNYELHHKAQELEDTHSSYQLARLVLLQREVIKNMEHSLVKLQENCNESN